MRKRRALLSDLAPRAGRRELLRRLAAAGGLGILADGACAGPVPGGRVGARLEALGLRLPPAPAPVATYAPFRRAGGLVYIAGQGPAPAEGVPTHGRLGAELTVADGYRCARQVGLSVLAVLAQACEGDLDRVVQCVRLSVFVRSAPAFTRQPEVADGASDLLVEVFGEAGLHARSAIGVGELPFGIAVEIESTIEVAS